MDLIKNFDFAEFDHDKILENVTPILLPERNVTSDQVSCKVPGMEDVRMLFAIFCINTVLPVRGVFTNEKGSDEREGTAGRNDRSGKNDGL